ncbi:MAG: hypothetical protein IPG17_21030 [Sandaracinaceae bacterium]|nr:hypothetical protein [Sandaracinaceae bacterium]
MSKAAGPQDPESWSGMPEDRFQAAQLSLVLGAVVGAVRRWHTSREDSAQ